MLCLNFNLIKWYVKARIETKLQIVLRYHIHLYLHYIPPPGSSLNGHVDPITPLHELCLKYDLWLHLRGHNLPALSLNRLAPAPSQPAHSVSLSLGAWLNLPSLPGITLFTNIGNDLSTPLSLQSNEKTVALPLWTMLKSLGNY